MAQAINIISDELLVVIQRPIFPQVGKVKNQSQLAMSDTRILFALVSLIR